MVGDSLGYRDHAEVACGVLGYGGCDVVGVVMVKVGDEVYIDGKYGGAGSIGIVERVTPTGRFVVNGIQYRQPSAIYEDDWCALSTGDHRFGGSAIRPLTERRKQDIQKSRLHHRIEVMRSKYCTPSDASLEALIELSAEWEKLMRLVGK